MNKPEHTTSGYFSFLSYLGIGFAMCTITGFATHPGIVHEDICREEQTQSSARVTNDLDRFNYLYQ